MAELTRTVAPLVIEHTCDHRGTSQPAGSVCRCSVCGSTWSLYAMPMPYRWIEHLPNRRPHV